jgi:hypothetical protein
MVVAYVVQLLLVYNKIIHVLLIEIFCFFRVEIIFLLVVSNLISMFLDY